MALTLDLSPRNGTGGQLIATVRSPRHGAEVVYGSGSPRAHVHISASPRAASPLRISSRPRSPVGARSPIPVPVTSRVLYQAGEERRTGLIRDRLEIVRQLNELDVRLASLHDWQTAPDSDFELRVQQRVADIHKSGPANVTDYEHVPHLEQALRAVAFEAEVWRQRALDMEHASDRDRAYANQLRDLELSVAANKAASDQSALVTRLREQELEITKLTQTAREVTDLKRELGEAKLKGETFRAAFEKLEKEYRLLESSRAADLDMLSAVRRRAADHEAECKRLVEQNAVTTSALHAAQREQGEARATAERQRARCVDAEALLEAERTNKSSVESQLRAAQSRLDMTLGDLSHANRKAETVGARCENLEVALTNSCRKQAELYMEREEHKLRADQLEAVSTAPGTPQVLTPTAPLSPASRSPKIRLDQGRTTMGQVLRIEVDA